MNASAIRTPGILLAAVLLACNGTPGDDVDGAPPSTADSPAADPSADPDGPVCLRGGPFVADGNVPADAPAAGDAERITALRWERHEGCERFVIDLEGPDGAAARSVGDVGVDVLRSLGVVRISLREVEWVDPEAARARFDGPLAQAAYSVWSPDGRWTYVDLHLGQPAQANATVLGDPARVVVDLRPGGGPIPDPPVTGERVVVLQPRPGAASYPLEVIGYSRTFEANVVARVEHEGEEVHEMFTTATAWVDAWGHYTMTIEDGPTGAIQLHVGEYSARDGAWEGVSVGLVMR